ncbi:MAG: hypothetical protein LUH15_08320 [Tannerellaceae bacterium]|nr:hypothetical protein [Tannerellaceae bacterium]
MKKAFIITLLTVSWGCKHTTNTIRNIDWDENLSIKYNVAKYPTGFSDIYYIQDQEYMEYVLDYIRKT